MLRLYFTHSDSTLFYSFHGFPFQPTNSFGSLSTKPGESGQLSFFLLNTTRTQFNVVVVSPDKITRFTLKRLRMRWSKLRKGLKQTKGKDDFGINHKILNEYATLAMLMRKCFKLEVAEWYKFL